MVESNDICHILEPYSFCSTIFLFANSTWCREAVEGVQAHGQLFCLSWWRWEKWHLIPTPKRHRMSEFGKTCCYTVVCILRELRWYSANAQFLTTAFWYHDSFPSLLWPSMILVKESSICHLQIWHSGIKIILSERKGSSSKCRKSSPYSPLFCLQAGGKFSFNWGQTLISPERAPEDSANKPSSVSGLPRS